MNIEQGIMNDEVGTTVGTLAFGGLNDEEGGATKTQRLKDSQR
jgi:hypothetical protein